MRRLNRVVVLAFACICMMACSGERQAVLSFKAPGLKLDSVRLVTGGETVVVAYDSTHAMQLAIDGFPGGFAELQFGRLSKLVYLEAGKTLHVHYERVRGSRESPYVFHGDLQAENVWLDEHTRLKPVNFGEITAAGEAISIMEDSAQTRVVEIKKQGFTPLFSELESKREEFAVYRSCRYFRHWDEQLYSFLRKVVREEPALLICEDYRLFLTESLGAIASETSPDYASFEHAKVQLDYIAQHFQTPDLRTFLASTVAIASMEQGVKKLDELMAITCPLIVSPQEMEEVEAVYHKWARMAPGTIVPDYVFRDIRDREVRLSDFRGKYLFIDCWATWCGPCRAQMAPLHELMEKYEGKNIMFMGVSSDSDREKWKVFVKEEEIPGIQVNIPSNDPFYEYFAVAGIPRFILIAPDGTVQDAMFPRPSSLKCQKKLDALL